MPRRSRDVQEALHDLPHAERDVRGWAVPQEGRGRILFADDDIVVLQSTSAALSVAGFAVTEVINGSQVLAKIEEQLPDALLIDIDMPGNRDLELLRALNIGSAFVPVVILTGRPTVDTAISAVRLGVVDYIAKPPKIDELLERLDLAVHRARVLRSIEAAETLAVELSERLAVLNEVIRQGPGARLVSAATLEATPNPLLNLSHGDLARLSPREGDVLRELAKGNSPQKIAATLRLSTNTIRNHLKSIFVKLGVNSQVALLGKLATPRR